MQVKTCPRCAIEKDLSLFYKDKNKTSGYMSWCKACCSVANKTAYSNNAEERRNNRRKYYYENREQQIADRGEFRKRNVDMHRGHKYKQLYGITLDQYEDMRCAQNYKCAICGLDEKDNKNKKLFVDHCHETKKVRALLCHWCNSALGSFRDNINILEKATAYLKEHNASG